jgi:hypothetical protein
MWRRLTELLARIGILSRDLPLEDEPVVDGPDDPEIQFRSLNPPRTDAIGDDNALVCPVTRVSLHQGSLLYLCRDCNTAYSAEGWAFLRETDKGRCCHCRHIGSVVPFHGGEAS